MPKLQVVRSQTIQAPAEQVFSHVRNFKEWSSWSPWLICEPDCPLSFEPDGTGYSWNGKIIGEGSLHRVGETPPELLELKLEFRKPFKSTSTVRFHFREKSGATEVDWEMDGSLPWFLFWLKPMMEAFIGMDYERGLLMLAEYVETGSVTSRLEFAGERTVSGFRYLGIRNQCQIKEIGPSMEADFQKLGEAIESHSLTPAGKPFSIYHQWDVAKGTAAYTIGFPVEGEVQPPEGQVAGSVPDLKGYTIHHTGPYHYLGNAWSAGYQRVQAKVIRQDKSVDPFEIYQNDPRETPPEQLITEVIFPVKQVRCHQT